MFSVIIPVHNKAPHLQRSVNSVLNQSYPNFELILIDDASTDGSSEEILKFTDPRVKRLRRNTPGPGGYAARNLGIKEAQNPWIAFLDADDEWKPDHLLNVAEAIEQNPEIKFFVSGYSLLDTTYERNGNYYVKNHERGSHRFNFSKYLKERPAWTGAVVVDRDTIIKAGLFPEGKASRGGDDDLWLKIMSKIRVGYWVNYLGAVYHRAAVNMVTKTINMDFETMIIYRTVSNLIEQETDKELILHLKKYWNHKAWFCFKNISKRRVIKFNDLKYYFWDAGIIDYKIFTAIFYSFKNLFGRNDLKPNIG